ncbi:Hypothetical protein POVR1_LOCUS191 [uncultured virus]|nr:Hypothetical protein POVR1_LOCUS191 [uncultured virus]
MNGLFTEAILQDLIDWCDPPMIMQLSSLPVFKILLSNPYYVQKLSMRFRWYAKSFDDFVRVYETKYHTNRWHHHFDREYRAVLAVQSRNFLAFKVCVDEIISSGRIRNNYLVYDLQNTLSSNANLSFEDSALVDYCSQLDHLKTFIEEQRHVMARYEKHIFHMTSKIIERAEANPIMSFDLAWEAIRIGSIDVFQLLNRLFGAYADLVKKLLIVDSSRFVGCVLSSRDPKIYDLLSPYIFAHENDPFYNLLPDAAKQGNFSYWILDAIASCDVDRIKICSRQAELIDQVFRDLNSSNRAGLLYEFDKTINLMLMNRPSPQLIFDVTQLIPVEHRPLWLELLVYECILHAKADILEYLLTIMNCKAPNHYETSNYPLVVQPCCLKVIILHSNPCKVGIMKCIESLRDFCAPETIKELDDLASGLEF